MNKIKVAIVGCSGRTHNKKSGAEFSREKYSTLSAMFFLACTSPAWGISEKELSEEAFIGEVPVVLTASRLAQPISETPAAVTIINREMIKNSGAWELSELMRLVPGMYVAYHASRFYSTDSLVSYHGLTTDTMSNRMQVLVDGRSVYSPLYGGVLWSDIPLAMDDIERIEVTRGPNSASYGANSFMGVINIISRHSAESPGTHASLSAGRGKAEGLLRRGGQNSDGNLTWRLTLGYRYDRGEDAAIYNSPAHYNYGTFGPDVTWAQNKFDNKRIELATFRSDYQINAADTLEFQMGYNGGPRQRGEPDDWYAPDKRARNHFEQFNWRRALTGGGELSVKYYHLNESSSAQLLNTSASVVDYSLTANDDVTARRDDLEVQHTFSPSTNTRLVWGGNVRHDNVFAPHEFGNVTFSAAYTGPNLYESRSYNLAGMFGNLEWRARPDLIFNAGGMLEKNSFTGTDFNPRLALNWHVAPEHTLRVSESYATRTPSVFDKRFEEYQRITRGLTNLPELKPERAKVYDIGYLGKWHSVDVDFRLFREEYLDLFNDNRNDPANRGNLNSQSAVTKGFETQLKWHIGEHTTLMYGLSHARVKSADLDKVIYSSSVPTNSQNWMLTHRFDNRWSASLLGYQIGDTHFTRSGSDPTSGRAYYIPGNRRWDSRVAYSFKSGTSNGELALNIQNLGNSQHFEYRWDNQAPPRTAWLNLKLDMP